MKRTVFSLLVLLSGALNAAELPYDKPSPADLSGNFRVSNECNTNLYLNGIWEIAPTLKIQETMPADSEFYPVPVPSSWMFAADFPIASSRFKRGNWGGACTYDGKNLQDFEGAWYRRDFIAPEVKPGQELLLAVDRVTIFGTVYLNGEKLGTCMERRPGVWNITDRVKPGVVNRLVIRVDAAITGEEKMFLGAEMTANVKQKATLRGITQDVRLVIRSAGVRVDDLFMKTSTRKQEITFELRVANPQKIRGTVAAEFLIRPYEKSEVVKSFAAKLELSGEAVQSFRFTFPWKDARLWEPDAPCLYQAEVLLKQDGKRVEHSLPRRFGFREVWIDGREMMLNGKPFRLITFPAANRDAFVTAAKNHLPPFLNLYRKAGFNTLMISNEYAWRVGGCAQFYEDLFDEADRTGWLVILPLGRVYDINWNSPVQRAEWLRLNRELMERYRNSPSLLFWSLNFNLLGYPWDLNPYAWASDFRPKDSVNDLGRKRREAAESEALIRAIDDSRIIYHHAGGNFGSMITSNFYISWPPLQERADYPEPWSKRGVRPFNAVELGFPTQMDYSRCRDGSWMTMGGAEPMEAEYCAPYLGREAYRQQEDRYLKIIDSNATDKFESNCDFYNSCQPYWWNYNLYEHAPVSLVQSLISPAYIRIWRAYGVNGFCPWVDERDLCGVGFEYWKHGVKSDFHYEDWSAPGAKPLGNYRSPSQHELCATGRAYERAFRPVLVWAGGSRAEGFSSRTHAFYAGEKVEKQLVVVNDSRHDLKLAVKWTLGGSSGTIPVEVAAGRRAFVPFELSMPQVEKRTEPVLKLQVSGVAASQLDVQDCPLQVFPAVRQGRGTTAPVMLFDPAGETTRAFQKLGISFVKGEPGALAEAKGPVVIGRGSLAGLPYPVLKVILDRVRAGGTLVVMAQKDLSPFGLRVQARGVRQMFPVGNPALLKGLKPVDFTDWRGGYSFLESDPEYSESSAGEYPEEPFRRGNRGSIASLMLEKPHTGGFRHLLEGEFDLDYAFLTELAEGKGHILFCQLDLAGRAGVDPVATELLYRLARWNPAPGREARPVRVIGTNAAKLAARLHIKTAPQSEITLAEAAALDSNALAELVKQAERGGTVFLLGPLPESLKLGNVTVQANVAEAYRAEPAAELEERAGTGWSDLFVKVLLTEPLVQKSTGVNLLAKPGVLAEVPCGRGKFVLVAVNPVRFRDSKLSPERTTRAAVRLGRAVAQLLAAEGAAFMTVSEKAAAGGALAPVKLPPEWKFRIDPENRGFSRNWEKAGFDDTQWRSIKVPGYWENQDVTDSNPAFPQAKTPYDGYAWYRCRVVIPESFRGKKLFLNLGVVDDMDKAFVNGREIGLTGNNVKEYWAVKRSYPIPQDAVKFGKENVIVVKVYDNFQYGGIVGPSPEIVARSGDNFPYTDAHRPFNPYRLKRW